MPIRGLRRLAVAGGALLLASCAAPQVEAPPAPVPPTEPANAVEAGLTPGPAVSALGLSREDAEAARQSFIESCPKLLARSDGSGIAADWTGACRAASQWAADPAGFFDAWFETARVGTGSAFLTGYYEPQIAGVRVRQPGYDVPVYAMPTDFVPDPSYTGTGKAPTGRIDAEGTFVPYYERAEIVAGAIGNKAPIIGWAKDPVDFFFLQIQGSGQLVAPDGNVVRIGYAGQNGREYVAIGKILRERGVFQPGEATMQKIVDWLHANPAQADEVMNQNKSWIFFRELTGDGPVGALGVPVRPHASVAADPRFVPLGAPVWIDAAHDEADGLWIAQDTGGAIKGANRFDTFWGAGPDAARIAGGMSSDARAYVLLPKGTLARIGAP
ncbi:MltA domain-containing protein [Croceicoccus sp. BE223]|uniref:murein transglycosylase A n=1 Tax=Croceicoccus sp. BE223 TaxID=2817716 RepID=UPI00285538DA|nr:MltA domain-containing protein [Croceicoccus sp. BE223]MDR7100991.1 membrane-bound lytic murein transglycosylase A [Croceicoccus sp. BE223]